LATSEASMNPDLSLSRDAKAFKTTSYLVFDKGTLKHSRNSGKLTPPSPSLS